jgi:hypothetical protein
MPESTKTTETVVNKSKVTIPLEEYDRLKDKSTRPVVNENVTVIHTSKTDEQNARDNMIYGVVLNLIGLACAVAGTIVYKHGKRSNK